MCAVIHEFDNVSLPFVQSWTIWFCFDNIYMNIYIFILYYQNDAAYYAQAKIVKQQLTKIIGEYHFYIFQYMQDSGDADMYL